MSFTKRIITSKMLGEYFLEDRENGISRAIGRADCLIIRDDESAEIINLWQRGDRDSARNMMIDVLRISSALSSDHRGI